MTERERLRLRGVAGNMTLMFLVGGVQEEDSGTPYGAGEMARWKKSTNEEMNIDQRYFSAWRRLAEHATKQAMPRCQKPCSRQLASLTFLRRGDDGGTPPVFEDHPPRPVGPSWPASMAAHAVLAVLLLGGMKEEGGALAATRRLGPAWRWLMGRT